MLSDARTVIWKLFEFVLTGYEAGITANVACGTVWHQYIAADIWDWETDIYYFVLKSDWF